MSKREPVTRLVTWNPEHYARIKAEAEHSGLSVSALIRMAVLGWLNGRPSKEPRAPKAPPKP